MALTRGQLTAVSARLQELIVKAQLLRDGINRQLVQTAPKNGPVMKASRTRRHARKIR
jgi:hypothetical protein